MLEILNFLFVLFGGFQSIERAEIPAFVRFGVHFP